MTSRPSRRLSANPALCSRSRQRRDLLPCACSLLLCLLLLAEVLGGWSQMVPAVFAASRPRLQPPSLTLSQFLQQGRHDTYYRGSLIRPRTAPRTSGQPTATDYTHLPPSAEPPTMQPLSQPLDASFLSGSVGSKPLDLMGSDHRLEVQLSPGSLDLSHAALADGKPPQGTLTLRLTQLFGHFAESFSMLGAYEIEIVDDQGHPVNGIALRIPIVYIYHYQPWELDALDLDPARLTLRWPELIATALQAHQSARAFFIRLHDDTHAHTLTAQSSLSPSKAHRFDMGGGDPQNQSPTTPHLASTEGNAGQLTYSYPLQLPPGPNGLLPPYRSTILAVIPMSVIVRLPQPPV